MSNPLGKVIPKKNGKRLAIGDVHGCHQTLRALLDKLSLQPEDSVFFLGDYVNKGPSGKKVLDCISELSEYCQVHALLGNHDKMVLDYLLTKDPDIRRQLSDITAGDEFFELSPTEHARYTQQLSGLHHYFISSDYILVHAGLDFTLSNPFLGKEAMLNIRAFYYDSAKAQNKRILHGHVPHTMDEINERIGRRARRIPLDNGCVYAGERDGLGKLLCYNLDTHELIAQDHCD